MCDYTEVTYQCGHIRYLVLAWCIRYQQTHERCPPNVVRMETKYGEKCGVYSKTFTLRRFAETVLWQARAKPTLLCEWSDPYHEGMLEIAIKDIMQLWKLQSVARPGLVLCAASLRPILSIGLSFSKNTSRIRIAPRIWA